MTAWDCFLNTNLIIQDFSQNFSQNPCDLRSHPEDTLSSVGPFNIATRTHSLSSLSDHDSGRSVMSCRGGQAEILRRTWIKLKKVCIHQLPQSKACFIAVKLKPLDLILTLMSSWVRFSGVFIRYTILLKPSSSPIPVVAEHGWMYQALPAHTFLKSSFRQSSSGLRAPGRSCLLAKTKKGTSLRLSYLRT